MRGISWLAEDRLAS
jgi:hypothetical protein